MELEPNHLTRMNDNLAMILRTLEAQNELLRRLLTEIEKLGPAEGVGTTTPQPTEFSKVTKGKLCLL